MDHLEHLELYINSSELTSQTPSDSRNIEYPLWNLDYFILAVLISILSIIGILGNIPVLIVYIRRKDKKASNTFIQCLAFLDLLVCSFIMPYSVVYEFHLVTSDITCRTFEVLRHFTIMASNITLVAIAVERYVAVCQIGTKISLKNIKRGVWAIVFVSFILASPAIGTFAVVDESEVEEIKCNFPHEATSGQFCHFTFTIMGRSLVLVYQLIQMALFCVILIVIVILYAVIYVVLWKKTKIRRQLTKRHLSVVSGLPASYTETFLSELAEKCNTRAQTLKAVVPEDGFSSSQSIPLKAVNENPDKVGDEDSSRSSTELDVGKPETKVTFHNNVDFIRKPNKSDVTVTSDCNGDNLKSSSSETKSLKSSFGKGDKGKKKRYYHRRTAKMLFLCTVIYFVTWLPFWLDIFGLTNSLTLRYLFFIGNASNPIVYGIVNVQVRTAIKKLFLSYCARWCSSTKYSEETDNTLNCSSSVSQ